MLVHLDIAIATPSAAAAAAAPAAAAAYNTAAGYYHVVFVDTIMLLPCLSFQPSLLLTILLLLG
jgi:hypothetical protein